MIYDQDRPWAADLHIHSRFSRATARDLEPGEITRWAARKGLALVGTGDLTHAGWLAELEERLAPAGEGLFKLAGAGGPEAGVRFVLSGEVSCIFKQGERTRKVHLVVLMPSLEAARRFNQRLAGAGANLVSDGRPIMGLKARQILELVLETDPLAEMIPAHIWTPWFSVLGSKSGFDSLEECFGDLSPQVHAVETGLSSDPPMNWRVSDLDGYSLVSSSDAHSPSKLGREATLFSGPLTYANLIRALRTGEGLEGTLEFFPEEGKYHLDGHRKCGVRLEPGETRARKGLCPVCGRPVTVGVLHRVEVLADREAGRRPETARRFESLLSLTEILGQVLGTGPNSKKVQEAYERLLEKLGPELSILREQPLEEVERAAGEVAAEAIRRVREGRVEALAGYDGEFGKLNLFSAGERAVLARQGSLFALGGPGKTRERARPGPVEPLKDSPTGQDLFPAPGPPPGGRLPDPDQEAAVEAGPGPLTILAGPGGGKTGVLVRRVEGLMERGADPSRILLLTFTRKAAGELAKRLEGPGEGQGEKLTTATFHSLGLGWLERWGLKRPVLSEEERLELIRPLAKAAGIRAARASELIARAKLGPAGNGPETGDGPPKGLLKGYGEALESTGVYDYEDLITVPLELAARDRGMAEELAAGYDHLLVDEFQDLNRAQYDWLERLAPGEGRSLTVVGDPDQSIYAFRGASPRFFQDLARDRPGMRTLELRTSYRCPGPVLLAARALIARNPGRHLALRPLRDEGERPSLASLASPRAEAVFICQEMERLMGGTSHLSQARGGMDGREGYGLAEIAVLFRLHRQAEDLVEALERAGLPYQLAGQEPGREQDDLILGAEKITLLTFHAAKGLEFPLVFLAGLEEGLLPYRPPGREGGLSLEEVEEERRLFYVALTRARERLVLSRARKRSLFGQSLSPGPSPFLAELPAGLVREVEVVRPARRQVQPALF